MGGHDADTEKPKTADKSLSQYNSVHHKYHKVKGPGFHPGLQGDRPTATCMNHARYVQCINVTANFYPTRSSRTTVPEPLSYYHGH